MIFEHMCDASSEMAPCLRDRGCGWCRGADGEGGAVGGRCLPCALDALSGATRCDLGASDGVSHACESWTHAHDLTIVGGTGGRSRRLDTEVQASGMAYLRVAPPHPHGVLRLLVTTSDRMRMFLRRGGAPPANASLEIGSRWPLDLPGSLNITDVAGVADGGDLADAAAWYLGIQAGVFYEQPIAHPHRVQVGDTLDPLTAGEHVAAR